MGGVREAREAASNTACTAAPHSSTSPLSAGNLATTCVSLQSPKQNHLSSHKSYSWRSFSFAEQLSSSSNNSSSSNSSRSLFLSLSLYERALLDRDRKMIDSAEALLRQAIANGEVSLATLQAQKHCSSSSSSSSSSSCESHKRRPAAFKWLTFDTTDYAGVARVLKIDPELTDVVVAVKLQEIDGEALLSMKTEALRSLDKTQQGDRLRAFLAAIQRVASGDPTAAATQQQQQQQQQQQVGAVKGKKRGAYESISNSLDLPLKKKPAVKRGLQAPRISGLQKPPPSAATSAAATAATAAAATAAAEVSGSSLKAEQQEQQEQQQPVHPKGKKRESRGAKDKSKESHKEGADREGHADHPSSEATPVQQQQQKQQQKQQQEQHQQQQLYQEEEQQQQQQQHHEPLQPQEQKRPQRQQRQRAKQQQRKPLPPRHHHHQQQQQQQKKFEEKRVEGSSCLRSKLMAWASSVLSLRSFFHDEINRQAERRKRRALLSTTGFAEGASVQGELGALVRKLGPLEGAPLVFERKPEALDQITHLLCSDDLQRPTVKLYFALATGGLLLREDFWKEARSSRSWPDPLLFQRTDFPSLEDRLQSRWLLKGLPVSVEGPCTSAALSKQQLQRLVGALGGRLADEASASVRLFEDLETARRRQARGLLETSKGDTSASSVSLVSAQWLLDCVRTWSFKPFDLYLLRLSSETHTAGETRSSGQEKSVVNQEKQRKQSKAINALNTRKQTPAKQQSNSNSNSSSSSKKTAHSDTGDEGSPPCQQAPGHADPRASTLPQQQQQQQQQGGVRACQSKGAKRGKRDRGGIVEDLSRLTPNAKAAGSSSASLEPETMAGEDAPRDFARITQDEEEQEEGEEEGKQQQGTDDPHEGPPPADMPCAAAAAEGAPKHTASVAVAQSRPFSVSSERENPNSLGSLKADSLRGVVHTLQDNLQPAAAEQLEVAGLFEPDEGEDGGAFDFDLEQQQFSQQQDEPAVCSSSSSKQEALGVSGEPTQRRNGDDENAPANNLM
ncbi:hypothetical protein Emag_000783 [Eimeria magna]